MTTNSIHTSLVSSTERKMYRERLNKLEQEVETALKHWATGAPTVNELRKALWLPDLGKGNAGFTKFLKARFHVANDNLVYSRYTAPVTEDEARKSTSELCKQMAKTIDRMAREIEALYQEIEKLRKANKAPELSERARKALAVYGD